MNYVGIDYHKKYSVVTTVNESGQMLSSKRIDNHPEALEDYFEEIEGPSRVVLEACRTWGVMFDMLEEMQEVESVQLAHPQKVRAIAEAKIKTDKIDSLTLAQLLRADLIPAAYIPGKETRSYKDMIRQRIFMVRTRTKLKNRLHVLLDRQHISMPLAADVFGKRGMAYLRNLDLPGPDGEILRENLNLLEVLNQLIKEAEKEIGNLLGKDERVQRLRTIPGLGAILSAVVALEIDQIERFTEPKNLAAYAGLVPSTYASGGKCFHGHLLPMSNKWLRWALVEASWVAIRHSAYCRNYFEKHKRRKGANTAIIALARRLGEIIWHVWKENRGYEERACFLRKNNKKTSPVALSVI